MQFFANGPDVPEALLQAHEDGKVVFFCGAGISYPAGLPGFKGLVQELYDAVGENPDPDEKQLFESKRFDETIGHLEKRIQGGRANVRRHLAEILKPELSHGCVLRSHLALLVLSCHHDGLHLVTTNFDTLFEKAAENHKLALTIHPDPPARHPWQGLVYLHGRMPQTPTQDDLDRLILSDADFGKAYLTEAWAARFMTALFREHTVCFVGYSVNDPVLRYMAAAHAVLEGVHKIYAFAGHGPENKDAQNQAWENKHVIPILYDDRQAHRHLHRTLQVWASLYRSGTRGRERLVARLAHRQPRDATESNDFVGRMLWALSDPSGLPAKRFAQLDPVPSLEWLLDAFTKAHYQHADLPRFGMPVITTLADQAQADSKKPSFSLIQRPTPSARAPRLALVSGSGLNSGWDDVMFQLARWLTRHLNDAELITWLAAQGGQLHPQFAGLIEDKLNEIADLERDGKTGELDQIRLHAPNAIPSPLMRKLWHLMLTGRIESLAQESKPSPELRYWMERLKREGLNTALRLELRALLAPQVRLRKPICVVNYEAGIKGTTRNEQSVGLEIVLADSTIHMALRDLTKATDEGWQAALPALLDDFQLLLRDALDLRRELDEADDHSDRSSRALPPINPPPQNRKAPGWVVLIELLSDAWLAIQKLEPERATRHAQAWFHLPYSAFKRLALFAASQDDCITPEQWVDWLLADDAQWLWSVETQQEKMRLLVLQGRHLAGAVQERLEAAILAGPPRGMYEDDLEPELWQAQLAHSVWLHLAKLESSGLALGTAARTCLEELTQAHPDWQLAPDEDNRDIDIAPRKRRELVQWLAKPPPEGLPLYEKTWRNVCRTRFFHSLYALCDLARNGVWPTDRWRVAMHAWRDEDMVQRSWRYAAPLVRTMPDDVLHAAAHSITRWLETVSKSTDCHEDILLDLCSRILDLALKARTGITLNGAPVEWPATEAIKHPIERVTDALINLWFKQNPNDNDLLPADLKPIFTALCDVQVERFRHGRVLLGSQLIAFFRVDRPWTEQHLLPLFGWSNPLEARAVWIGFLASEWDPCLPLLKAFKPQFLDSANHYADLGEHRKHFAAFLTYAALEPAEGYTKNDFRSAIEALPQEGLEACAWTLVQALEAAADQREAFWENRILPLWQEAWPKSRDRATWRVADALAHLCIAAGAEFPDALNKLGEWLQPLKYCLDIVEKLHENGLSTRFPEAALELLDKVVADGAYTTDELRTCLDDIARVKPELRHDPRYKRLDVHARKHGA